MRNDLIGPADTEEVTRLFVDRANAHGLDGLVALYEPQAIMAYPPGTLSAGHEQIRLILKALLCHRIRSEREEPAATLRADGLAVTTARRRDGQGIRVQLLRQQPDGSWLRLFDLPEPASE